jgi:hypothetical protein
LSKQRKDINKKKPKMLKQEQAKFAEARTNEN